MDSKKKKTILEGLIGMLLGAMNKKIPRDPDCLVWADASYRDWRATRGRHCWMVRVFYEGGRCWGSMADVETYRLPMDAEEIIVFTESLREAVRSLCFGDWRGRFWTWEEIEKVMDEN